MAIYPWREDSLGSRFSLESNQRTIWNLMPYADDDDETEQEYEAREYPEDDEADWNLDPATGICPWCGEEISEDAQRCPVCGEYLSKEDAPREKKPLWIKIGLACLVLILIAWILNWY